MSAKPVFAPKNSGGGSSMVILDQYGDEVPTDLLVLKSELNHSELLDLPQINDILEARWYKVEGLSFILLPLEDLGFTSLSFCLDLAEAGLTHKVFDSPLNRVAENDKLFTWKQGFYVRGESYVPNL